MKRIQPGRTADDPAITPESIEALRDLAIDGADNILTELIDTFLESAPGLVTAADRALVNVVPHALAQAAHTLKGSCSNFGAKPLQELCAQLEILAHSPDFQDSPHSEARAAQLLKCIRLELARVGTALREYRTDK